MASNLDSIPKWKKDLITRKRTQSKCTSIITAGKPVSEQLLCPSAVSHSEAGTSTMIPECDVEKQASLTRSSIPVEYEQSKVIHVSKQCDVQSLIVNNKQVKISDNTMVQDSVLLVHKPVRTSQMISENIANGDYHTKNEVDSDSSEELQYGPGIVSKLKSKYLSLTLREKNVKPRPSILNMRRATSLENILDADSDDELIESNLNDKNVRSVPAHSRRFVPRVNSAENGNVRNPQTRYRTTTRGNDSMKRTRSVETLRTTDSNSRESLNEDVVIIEKEGNANHRKQQDNNMTVQSTEAKPFSCNGSQIINRPKRLTSFMDETERPPADHVKQTMMLFEGPPVRRTKSPKPTGEVAAMVANFKHIMKQEKNIKKPVVKPQITPKPVVNSADNTRKLIHRPASPKKTKETYNRTESSSDKMRSGALSPEIRLPSPALLSPDVAPRPSPIPDVSRISETCEKTGSDADPTRSTTLSETPDLILHSSPMLPNLQSSDPSKKVTENLDSECEAVRSPTSKVNTNGSTNVDSRSPSPRLYSPAVGSVETRQSPIPVDDSCDGLPCKEVTKQSMENIGQAGQTITFAISDNISKSHLPRLSTVSVGINRLVPDIPKTLPSNHVLKPSNLVHVTRNNCDAVSEIGAEVPKPQPSSIVKEMRPSASTTVLTNATNTARQKETIKNVDVVAKSVVNRPPTPIQNKNLTSREITKNLYNNAKTFEQPVSKVVVSVRSVEDVVVNNILPSVLNKSVSKQGRNQEQNSLRFNFQDRETVPDYIAHDSTTSMRRGKREKPKHGESGVILLPDAPVDEFEDEEESLLSLNGPPSPCDVLFENDNVLIDGKSSISKHPKRQKLRIQFDDDATQLFMYPSESSLLEESPTIPAVPPPPASTVVTSTPGRAVPSLSGSSLACYQPSKMDVTARFQLGVTRSIQSPIVTAPTSAPTEIEQIPQEPDQPITYSSETNADILF